MRTVRKLELRARRVPLAAESRVEYGAKICDVTDAARVASGVLRDEAVEVFVAVMLDSKHRILGYHEAARGSITTCAVDPASVFRTALIAGAVAVVVAHNHPSGDTTPSGDDDRLTKQLAAAGKMLGLPVLDHLIVGDSAPTHSYAQSSPNDPQNPGYIGGVEGCACDLHDVDRDGPELVRDGALLAPSGYCASCEFSRRESALLLALDPLIEGSDEWCAGNDALDDLYDRGVDGVRDEIRTTRKTVA